MSQAAARSFVLGLHRSGACWCKTARFSSGNKPKWGSRTSVTIPADHLEMLQVIADGKKVSVAWVIRDAIEKYIDAEAEKGKA